VLGNLAASSGAPFSLIETAFVDGEQRLGDAGRRAVGASGNMRLVAPRDGDFAILDAEQNLQQDESNVRLPERRGRGDVVALRPASVPGGSCKGRQGATSPIEIAEQKPCGCRGWQSIVTQPARQAAMTCATASTSR